MAPAEQDEMDDDHDSGLDGGPGRSDGAGFGLDGADTPSISLDEWLEFTRANPGAEIPENGLSDENLRRYTQIIPRPSRSHRSQQSSEQRVLRLRGTRSRSSEPMFMDSRGVRSQYWQRQDTPQDESAQGREQMVLRLRGVRNRSSEQQDTPQDGLAQGSQQMVLRLRGARSQDGLAQSSEQHIASQDDLSQNNSTPSTASDAGHD